MTAIESAQENLAKYFGFTHFRQGQAEVIQSVLDGDDALVVMPTGSGKSLCYQLPATLASGVTLVISPLIALMKDQVDSMARRGLPATYVNSSLGYREVIERLKGILAGRYKLVFVAPERFRNEAFVRTIKDAQVSLLAVDEAHCISHWGHDFRPDYLNLRHASEVLGSPTTVALTATATPEVRQDIIDQLGLVDPKVFITGFDRPNLALSVIHVSGQRDKLDVLKAVISRSIGSGVVYAATRKSAEQITSRLKMAGLSAEAYHGGMSDQERTRAQNRFMDGSARTIVATSAFGMGIDKSDIRFVVHYDIPGSMEQYYQEIGRAGRDDAPAQGILLFNYADTRTQRFFIEGSHPDPDVIRRVFDAVLRLAEENAEVTAQRIAEAIGTRNEMSVRSALTVLEQSRVVERGRQTEATAMVSLVVPVEAALDAVPGPSIESTVLDDLVYGRSISDRQDTELDLGEVAADLGFGPGHVRAALSGLAARGLIRYSSGFRGRGVRLVNPDVSGLVFDRTDLEARARRSETKLARMIEYCYSRACLRRFVLNYFGDPIRISRCGACSSCDPKSIDTLRPVREKKDRAGTLTLNKPGALARSEKNPPASVPGPNTGARAGVTTEISHSRHSRISSALPQGLNASPAHARALTESEILIVKKVLSCIARLNDRFGKGTIAKVLAGSSSAEISTHALARIPTFGALSDTGMSQINQYIKALVAAACVEVNTGSYPTLRLSDFGREVMAGRAEVFLDFAESQEI